MYPVLLPWQSLDSSPAGSKGRFDSEIWKCVYCVKEQAFACAQTYCRILVIATQTALAKVGLPCGRITLVATNQRAPGY